MVRTMPSNFATLPEIRRAARKRLSRDVWNFGAGGSETETSMRRNRAALDRLAIRQDVLVDVREIDLSTTFLGMPLSMPVAVAPMGGLVLFHPEGDVEMARGASLADALVVLSGATGWPVEDVAAAGPGPKLFQLYHHGDRAWVADLLARVDAVAGRAEIVVDGGFRRGTDVIKAVALGANVVAMGRTILWGLAADGAAGVACALDILRSEIRTTLGLCGQTSIRGLRPDI